jgi:transcriptional regulator with PAS, ATPase and Fis domain
VPDELPLEDAAPGGERLGGVPIHHLGRVIGAILRLQSPSRALPAPQRPSARYRLEQILGESPPLRAAVELAQIAARNDLPVVLAGESGTGKELFAHGIHAASDRAGGPFVVVNCGALPAPLAEGELLGYEPGRLNEAGRDGRVGKLEQAGGGTLFLDEVGELAPVAQTALLRALQESEVTRLGGLAPRPLDVRVVAATTRRLADEVAAGRLRPDLFFRLNVLAIEIPPLRDRREDVPLLAAAALADAQAKLRRAGLTFGDDALAALAEHSWPGNVRELRNVVMRAAAVATGPEIARADLQLAPLRPSAPAVVAAPAPAAADDADAPLAPDAVEAERRELLEVLEKARWNIARTASSLGISRMTLYRRLRKLGITR